MHQTIQKNKLIELFHQYLKENHYNKQQPQELYAPLDYILNMGGKRMRPLSTLLACQLFSKEVDKALPAAYAIEIFHNFSLIHDDIMDQSTLRRGLPTVHQKWNTNTAILSGDVLLVYAYQHLSKVAPDVLPPVLKTFNEVAIGVCEGQQIDMNFEERAADAVQLQEYLKMIELKTSILVYGAMKIGAIIGGATLTDAENVAEFGRHLGIAFQLQDDYLDTFGQTAKVGKRIGGDIIQNKKTYLVIKALELANPNQQKTLINWLSKEVPQTEEDKKIEAVTTIFNDLDIPQQMRHIIQSYSQKALDFLAKVQVSDQKKQPLIDLLNQLMVREY